MTEREDQGRALLRLLQGVQVTDNPPVERQETLSHPEFASGTSFPSTLPMTDVRGAAAGEQHDNALRNPPVSNMDGYPYHLPRPGASASSPARSAGADLLRMLQGAPQSPATTRQRQQSLQRHYVQDLPPPPPPLPPPAAQHQHYHQYQQQHQQHLQHYHLASPTPPAPAFKRSIAAEQERFLKKFLRIEGADNEARSTPTFSTATPLSPAPPSAPLALSATTAATSTLTPAAIESGDQESQGRNNKSRTKERGKNRGPRGGRSRGGGGGGENNAEISSTPARERSKRSISSARGHMEASSRGKGGQKGRGARSQIEANGREAKKSGRGGGGRNGGGWGSRGGGRSRARSPSPAPAYAWSAFQNSPDPKNIPIPSLSHFSVSSDTSAGDETLVPEDKSSSCRDEMVVDDGRIQTPPPERDARPTGEDRSSAQRAEDDIKRMLRLG